MKEESLCGAMDTRRGHTIWERLDRAVATIDWLIAFPPTKVVHLECGTSNHKLILIMLAGIPKYLQKPWRFKQMWMEEEGCHEAIKSA